ncbi:MAG: FKBP-type peptidyl-prolyl cis-trans isomerase [Myxococcales bacterium]|nr:FKBP-type peptidyl-prolyl cis-trans isomerase [Myxococcales bacterium]
MRWIAISGACSAIWVACAAPRQSAPAPAPTVTLPAASTEAPPDPRSEAPPEASPSSSRILPSGLGVEDLKLGTGAMAEPGQRVRLHYVGTLEDGRVFDSSRARDTPFEARLGQGQLIKGFEEGVAGMRVGGLRRLLIPPELGYGERGTGNIPPSSILIFEVELLAVITAP